jgi:hypothetical protein
MRNEKKMILAALLGLGLGLTACGGDPMKPAMDALKAGDFAKAESTMDALAKDKPDLKALHATRFELYSYEAVHADPSLQQGYVTKSIAEYDFLAQALNLKPDYQNMEASVRTNPEGAALVSAARKPIFGE